MLKNFVYLNLNHEYANYANKVICISDREIKGLCLSFYLVPNLVAYDT